MRLEDVGGDRLEAASTPLLDVLEIFEEDNAEFDCVAVCDLFRIEDYS